MRFPAGLARASATLGASGEMVIGRGVAAGKNPCGWRCFTLSRKRIGQMGTAAPFAPSSGLQGKASPPSRRRERGRPANSFDFHYTPIALRKSSKRKETRAARGRFDFSNVLT